MNSEIASIYFVEKGYQIPEKGISVVFDPEHLNDLVSFLDASKQPSMDNRIVGKIEDNYEIISYEDIILFEAQGNNIYSVTHDQKYKVKKNYTNLKKCF